MSFPMLIHYSARPRVGLHSLFRECGGCCPFLQIAFPYVSPCSDSFFPRSPSSLPEHWPPDKLILAAPILRSRKLPCP